MKVDIVEVSTKKQLKQFIHLPAEIHKNHKTWLPPIYSDEKEFFNKNKNKSYSYSDTILFIAYKNTKAVGRIMGIINKRYNKTHNENHGRFIFMECYNNQETAHALISAVEVWAREKGMCKLIGPLGFSDKDPQGFQIEGFEYQAVLATVANFPYMVNLIENEGFMKKIDLNDYLIKIPEELPKIHKIVYDRISKRNDIKILEFANRKELKPYIIPILNLMNESYESIYGFVPLTLKEMKEFANRYLPILNPKFVKAVKHKDEIIGFVISIPDLSKGLKKSKGYLFPFGIFKILHSMKKTDNLILFLGAIKKKYQSIGIDVMMGIKLMESASKYGIKTMESHLVLENNLRMNGEYNKINGEIIKKFRIFQKDLKS